MQKPTLKPQHPNFSSGPCQKRPGWSLEVLENALLGRSHRATGSKEKLKQVIDLQKQLLNIPADYLVGIVPGSDTGAIEAALWSMLGARPVTIMAWDVFGLDWLHDIVDHLNLPQVHTRTAAAGDLPDLSQIPLAHDIVFTWNGTTSGTCLANGDWISDAREGLTFCDAISAVFAVELPWSKLDVTTYSWQKGLGSEAAHGMIVLSPRAVARLLSYTPTWPLPKLFRLTDGGKLKAKIFEGETINTPSMLCVEDCLDSLKWAHSIGGLEALIGRSQQNFKAIENWVANHPWIDFLAKEDAHRSHTSVCLKFTNPEFVALPQGSQWQFIKNLTTLLEEENAALDIKGHASGVPCLRIWAGPTVEKTDLEAMLPWIEWGYHHLKNTLS